MQERGIDLTNEFPKPWTNNIIQAANIVITINCPNTCPIFPNTRYLNWNLTNPTILNLDTIRPTRNKIEHHVRELLNELDVPVCDGDAD